MNRNIKLSPLYIALTWDVFFVWTISTMFFSTQKHLSYSQIIALDSILMAMGCVLSVPVSKLLQNVKPLTATRLGSLGYGAYLLLCIVGTQYVTFIAAQFFLALAYSVNSIKINPLLTKSLKLVKRDKDYQRVFGQGMSVFYVIQAVGAVLITYVYDWKPYVAYWIALSMVVFLEVYSLFLKEPSKFQKSNVNIEAKIPQKEAKPDSFKIILTSTFFVSLLLFMFFMRGIVSISGSAFKIYMQELTEKNVLPIWAFGYLYAGCKLFTAISTKYQFKFDLKYGVRSIILFVTLAVASFVVNGILYLVNPTAIISIVVILAFSYIQNTVFQPLRIFVNNYMQVCIKPKNIERAYAIRTSVEYLGYAIISAIYAALLARFNDNYGLTSLTYIAAFALPLIVCMFFFIRALIRKYTRMNTIIKKEYTMDEIIRQ